MPVRHLSLIFPLCLRGEQKGEFLELRIGAGSRLFFERFMVCNILFVRPEGSMAIAGGLRQG
jgi:hypothetical protein